MIEKKLFKPEWRKKTEAKCQRCGKSFQAVISEIKRGGGKFCSRACQRYDFKIKYKGRNYNLKKEADRVFLNARRRGEIIAALYCSQCGSNSNVQGHHDDYALPLVVRWLCGRCHQAVHAAK